MTPLKQGCKMHFINLKIDIIEKLHARIYNIFWVDIKIRLNFVLRWEYVLGYKSLSILYNDGDIFIKSNIH